MGLWGTQCGIEGPHRGPRGNNDPWRTRRGLPCPVVEAGHFSTLCAGRSRCGSSIRLRQCRAAFGWVAAPSADLPGSVWHVPDV